MADIMMINGDISASLFGDIATVDIYDDITQSAIHNIMLHYGEYEFKDTLGNMAYSRRNKISTSNLTVVESDCRNAVMADTRVSEVLSMVATKSETNNTTINIAFTLKATDGAILSSSIQIII